ncbi:hypothetical protein DFAR_1000002 [Desulfarculales bacterium]
MVMPNFFDDNRPRKAALVDASVAPGFYHAGLDPQAGSLRLAYKVAAGNVYHSFREPEGVERILDPWEHSALSLDDRPLG